MKRCKDERTHLPRCCPGRPRCYWNRKKNPKWKRCECGNYHYPHRRGSGLCEHNPDPRARWAELYGPESMSA